MDSLTFLVENREIIKLFYGLLIGLICFVIVSRVDKLFRLSLHQGIRYFRNAFVFYGIAFIVRYVFGYLIYFSYISWDYFNAVTLIFKYFLIMAGFFLLYSLIWKKIENQKENYRSSLLNPRIVIFYAMSFLIIFLDYFWKTHHFIFISQIILFTITSGISLSNFVRGKKSHKFLKFYFIIMILSLMAWILNSIAALFEWNPIIIMTVSGINVITFLLFLYGVFGATRLR